MLCLKLNITFTSEVDIYIIKTLGLKIIYCLYLLLAMNKPEGEYYKMRGLGPAPKLRF